MPVIVDDQGRELVDPSGRVYTEGCSPPCCGPSPSPYYIRFRPCPASQLHPCGLSGPPPGIEEIFVGSTVRCVNAQGQVGEPVLSIDPVPLVLWGGWCWYPADACRYVDPPPLGPGCSPLPHPPYACCLLPVTAVGPRETAFCVPGGACGAAACVGAMYAFLRPCPGTSGTVPPVYVCLRDLEPSLAAGVRCPSVSINGQCWWVDWPNARPNFPGNYTRLTGVIMQDGCCTCAGPPCVRAIAHDCPGTFTRVGGACCAHAIDGRATLAWEFTQEDNFGVFLRITGQAIRTGLSLSGSWTRVQFTISETFPISGSFAAGDNFEPQLLLSRDVNAGAAEKLPTGVCGLEGPGSQGGSGSGSSSCTHFTRDTVHVSNFGGANPVKTTAKVRYACSPNAGLCAGGCDDTGLYNGPLPGSTLPPTFPGGGPGGGGVILPSGTSLLDGGPGGLDAAVEAMARMQLGQPCRGCGG